MTSRKQREPSRPPERLPGKEPGLVQRTRRFLRRAFPDAVPHIVAGYSGGKDSLGLVLVLRELERLGACKLTVAHVDHRLRPESAGDAERVMQVAADLGVEAVLRSAPENLRRAFPGQSVEDIARRFRYEQLARVVEEVGADVIAVGHHQRDQAETVLLHLLRGAGLPGLSGMVPDSMLAVTGIRESGDEAATVVRVIRPFLHEPPDALAEFVRSSGVPVIEDPSNNDPGFRRNRIRHELLPLMEGIAPGAMSRLVSLADLAREDDTALDDVANRLRGRAIEGETLDWEAFQDFPFGLQRRVVRSWIRERRGLHDLSLDRVDAVIALALRGDGGKVVDIGGGWSVRYRRGVFVIQPPGHQR